MLPYLFVIFVRILHVLFNARFNHNAQAQHLSVIIPMVMEATGAVDIQRKQPNNPRLGVSQEMSI